MSPGEGVPTRWTKIATTGDVPDDDMIGCSVEGRSIGVYRIAGRLYAAEDVCPHARVLLSKGRFDGRAVECPIHAARFNVVTGRRLSGPVCRDLRTYPVRIEGDAILVDIEEIPVTRAL